MTRDEQRAKKRAARPITVRKTDDPAKVIVGSEVGVTLPVGDTTAHIRFSFWHERVSGPSVAAIRRTADQIDEFNEAELERRVRKYRRVIERTLNDEDSDEPDAEPRKKKKGSVQDRARKRMKK